MKTTRDGKARANRECDRTTRRCAEVPATAIVKVLRPIVALAMASMALGPGVALAEPVVSTAGYYEGHVRYRAMKRFVAAFQPLPLRVPHSAHRGHEPAFAVQHVFGKL